MGLKILLYIDHIAWGGAQRAMSTLANGLCLKEHTVIMINDVNFREEEFSVDTRVKRLYLNCPHHRFRIINNLKRICLLRKMIIDEKPDVAISFLGGPNIRMLVGLIGSKIPRIVSVRSDPNYEYGIGRFKRVLINLLFNTADRIVFQTDEAIRYFTNKIAKKSCIILNPVNNIFYSDSVQSCTAQHNNIIFVGRLTSEKNVEIIVRSFSKVKEKYPKYKLQICGDGPLMESLRNLTMKLGIANSVVFLGRTDNVRQYLMAADIFVMASNYEGLPNAMMEAMAVGVPCISTDCPCGGPRKLAKNGDEVLLIPVGDEDNLTKAMISLIETPYRREMLSINGRRRAEDFRADVICDEWESCIKEAIEKGYD